MPQVNIAAPTKEPVYVEMTQQEWSDFVFKGGILPARLGIKQLANGKRVTNEYEAYWAAQPAAVQALMYCFTETQRRELAEHLADQGFLIDVPIMVWGWDPLATMVVRKNQGYTWVPSAKQNPVAVAPGVNFPGLPMYDPKNPPAGSIPVTVDWAKGFEQTCPWPVDPADLKKFES